MRRRIAPLFRLAKAGWVLSAHRALVPDEARKSLPAPLRTADRAGALFSLRALRRRQPGSQGERLAGALQKLGPSYIKLGQMLATRSDIVGTQAAQGLARLHDRMPPFGTDVAEEVITQSLGQPVHALFSSLGPPVAAASVAQVHKALVTDDKGQRAVAVKILRPGVEDRFHKDLESFHAGARLASRLGAEIQRLKPQDVVDTLDASMRAELDLRVEAAAASEMAQNTAADPDFRVPAVDWTRTARRVLTTEWVDGIPLNRRDQLLEAGHDLPRLGRIVLQSFLRHALRDGFFHADMHPGNLFADSEGRVVAVDFGIVGRIDGPTRRFMAETLYGFITRDYVRAAEVHFEAGFVPASQSRADFALALRAIGEPIWGRPAREMSIARLLGQLFETTRTFQMELQPSLLLLQKTMVMSEGVARDLDPDVSIWETALPVIEDWMEGEIGAEARIREAVETVQDFGRAIARAPALLEEAERAVARLKETDKGLRLHPDTMRRIARGQSRRTERTILYFIAFLLATMLTVMILTLF